MKKPIRPFEPHKPNKASKTLVKTTKYNCHFYSDSFFDLKSIKENLEAQADTKINYENIKIGVAPGFEGGENVYFYVSVDVGEIENPNYEKQMTNYNNLLLEYKEALDIYNAKKIQYDKDMKKHEEDKKQKDIEKAKQILNKYNIAISES